MLDRSARLTLVPPTATGGTPITKYVIQGRDETAGTRWASIATVSTTSYLAAGLLNGHYYHFRVAAENSAGIGVFVEFGGVWIPPPTAPTILPARPLNGSVSLTWRTWPVPSHIGQPVAVRIERSTPGGSGYTWAGTTTPSAGSFVVKGLVNGERYYIRVGYLYRNGQYGWSSPQVVVPRTLPSAPRSPFYRRPAQFDRRRVGTALSDGGAPILGYRFQFSRDGRT